jgi:hypothetical protein
MELSNQKNYNKKIINTYSEIIAAYKKIVIEYLNYIVDNLNYPKMIIPGLETLTHVFIILLINTKNLELTIYHCQKTYYYYVEFMQQITNEHMFLKLTAKDAILGVYKATIFDINKTFVSPILPANLEYMHKLKVYAVTLQDIIICLLHKLNKDIIKNIELLKD